MNDRAFDIEREQALQRFFDLPRKDQLEVYRVVRDFLSAGDPPAVTKKDKVIDGQASALEAISLVARELELPDRKAPTSTQFAEVVGRVAPEWSLSKVLAVFGRWRVAVEVYERGDLRPNVKQLGIMSATRGKIRHDEGYWTAIRKWLRSEPPIVTTTAYNDWADLYNDNLPAGEKPLPSWTSIRIGLQLNFDEVVRVANGEITVDEARPYQPRELRPLDDEEGPHGLIPARVAADICGSRATHVRDVVYQPGFPVPALILKRVSLWRRDDVEAFASGRPFPERKLDELRDVYMTVDELAELVETRRETVIGVPATPLPAVVVGRQRLYLRAEVEAALPEMRRIIRRRRRHIPKQFRKTSGLPSSGDRPT